MGFQDSREHEEGAQNELHNTVSAGCTVEGVIGRRLLCSGWERSRSRNRSLRSRGDATGLGVGYWHHNRPLMAWSNKTFSNSRKVTNYREIDAEHWLAI